jgi:hypothetical protein
MRVWFFYPAKNSIHAIVNEMNKSVIFCAVENIKVEFWFICMTKNLIIHASQSKSEFKRNFS